MKLVCTKDKSNEKYRELLKTDWQINLMKEKNML